MRKRYKKIGRTRLGEAIYRDLQTGVLCIEIDYRRLEVATAERLEGAKFEEEVRKG